jgi:hypothetical protein
MDQNIWPLLDRMERIRETQMEHGDILRRLLSGQDAIKAEATAAISTIASGSGMAKKAGLFALRLALSKSMQWMVIALTVPALMKGHDIYEILKLLADILPKL